jgi:hypothetical protein
MAIEVQMSSALCIFCTACNGGRSLACPLTRSAGRRGLCITAAGCAVRCFALRLVRNAFC